MSSITNLKEYTGLFDLHLTLVEVTQKNTLDLKLLTQFLNLKLIQIELDKGDYPTQVMTSSTHNGTLPEVIIQSQSLVKQLKPFTVNRVKIEASPFNKDLPFTAQDVLNLPLTNYFEYHIKLIFHTQEDLTFLIDICSRYNAHLSHNANKKLSNNHYEKFVTLRLYQKGKIECDAMFYSLLSELKQIYTVQKYVSEYCVYDTNVLLDNNWLV